MLTLKELKKVVKVADMEADIPSAKVLKESGAEIVTKEILDTDTTIAVYENGYVLYQEGAKTTVFPLHKCGGYEYENIDGTRKRVKGEFFDNENWYVLPLLIASDRMIINQVRTSQYHGLISYSAVVEDRKYLIDPSRNCLDDMIEKELIVEELQQIKYNMLSMSAHKLGGPQGIGALILRKQRYKLPPVKPIMYGGQQEHGIRPGTLPVALIAGLGKACEIAEKEYKTNIQQCRNIKNKINTMLEESGLEYKYNGLQEYAMPTTMNICFKGVSSEALMLSSKDFCSISNGSACNSKSYSPSYVLLAMGIPKDQIESSVRISWGHDITIDEIEKSFQNVIEAAKGLVW